MIVLVINKESQNFAVFFFLFKVVELDINWPQIAQFCVLMSLFTIDAQKFPAIPNAISV